MKVLMIFLVVLFTASDLTICFPDPSGGEGTTCIDDGELS